MKKEFMEQAIELAKQAYDNDEVPVGAIVVKKGKVIGIGNNKREGRGDVFAHAEIEAIKEANKTLNSWKLDACDLYVTLEPCIMCAGAILQSRIKNVYFGCYEPKHGAFGSLIDVSQIENANHEVNVTGGIYEEECSQLLKDYFKFKRKKKKV